MHLTRMFLLASLAVLAATAAPAAETNLSASTSANKLKIGIMKFEVDPDLKPGLGTSLYNILVDQVANSAVFTVVDWEQMEKVQKLVAQAQPNVSPDDARKMAMHQLGIEKVYVGSLAKLGSKYHLSVKVLNLDLTIAASQKTSVATEDDLERAIEELAPALIAGALPRQEGEKYLAELKAQKAASPQTTVAPPSTSGTGSAGSAAKDKPFVNSLGMKFVPVPNNKVLFSVWETRVKDFEAFVEATRRDMGNSMWVVGTDGWKERGGYNWQKPGFRQTPDHPVVGVNWNDAVAFCEWLTRKERKEGKISPNQSYRLPTDEEWSEAVGLHEDPGGLPKDKDRKIGDQYPWGRSWPPPRGAGNYAGNEARTDTWHSGWKTIEGYSDEYPRTAPVGSFEANELGLFDLGGNAWEWCEDWYDGEQKGRVLRGASWDYGDSALLLSSYRLRNSPVIRSAFIGFRCVLVVGGASSG